MKYLYGSAAIARLAACFIPSIFVLLQLAK